jgi:hypothetical protein
MPERLIKMRLIKRLYMRLLVISLESEIGAKRREFLNYAYTRHYATDGDDKSDVYVKHIRDKLQVCHNTGPKKLRGISGAFASHWDAWDTIVDNEWYDTIILEDDAILIRDLPKTEDLPKDGACLLGGQIHHPHSWKMNTAFHNSGADMEIIKNFKDGINPIDYDKFRWSQAYAIYIPTPQVALKLSQKARQIGKFTHLDLWLAKHQLVKHLYYPAPFKHHDHLNQSQVADNPGIIVDYKKTKVSV